MNYNIVQKYFNPIGLIVFRDSIKILFDTYRNKRFKECNLRD